MCGIAGTVGIPDPSIAPSMANAMVHRGPDDQGTFWDPKTLIALAHRRLSIIDTSAAGHQPMSYQERYHIVFNGEIYNFAELREELKSLGHSFQSRSDTEVLLAAYSEWGEACLGRLCGMFAFAIYDRGGGFAQPSVFAARDRLGIKPFYYASVGGGLIFGSELKGLLASGMIDRRLDRQAIWDFLSTGSVMQPRTIFRQVSMLLPGHALRAKLNGEFSIWQYWDVITSSRANYQELGRFSLTDAAKALRMLLEKAIQRHLVSDVPIGAFLSGGIDSSLVVGLMSKITRLPIKTFSVGFEGPFASQDERDWARLAADTFKTSHTEVIVKINDIVHEIDGILKGIDQPSLDGANTYLVSKAASRAVKVCLSGLGGDELFAGYPHYRQFYNASRFEQVVKMLGKTTLKTLTRILSSKAVDLVKLSLMSRPERYSSLRSLSFNGEKPIIVNPVFIEGFQPLELVEQLASWFLGDLEPITELTLFELKGYLSNTLLRDADAMSMANSIELRPVLLDHEIVEFALSLADHHRFGNVNKPVLVKAVEDILPKSIIERKKMGFEMPLLAWLAGPLRERAMSVFEGDYARALFSEEFRKGSLSAVASGQTLRRLHWACFILCGWSEQNSCTI
jgi:asparagine synthase (glutamine-hydrolysing)